MHLPRLQPFASKRALSCVCVCVPVALGLTAVPTFGQAPTFEAERRNMVEQQVAARGVSDPAVLAAMRRVPRHEFVPEGYRSMAYRDSALPIGLEQTISQPYIVGLMTELLGIGPDARVLEVGTGSGYQAAVAAEIASEVYSIEIIPELARSAAERLERLGYANIVVREGDGYLGWPEHAPFDGIVVTAGADHVPPPLVDQLAPGGRMVIPVGSPGTIQNLRVVEKLADGGTVERNVIRVRFVPLTRR